MSDTHQHALLRAAQQPQRLEREAAHSRCRRRLGVAMQAEAVDERAENRGIGGDGTPPLPALLDELDEQRPQTLGPSRAGCFCFCLDVATFRVDWSGGVAVEASALVLEHHAPCRRDQRPAAAHTLGCQATSQAGRQASQPASQPVGAWAPI
jgi:hypothetical protein